MESLRRMGYKKYVESNKLNVTECVTQEGCIH